MIYMYKKWYKKGKMLGIKSGQVLVISLLSLFMISFVTLSRACMRAELLIQEYLDHHIIEKKFSNFHIF